MERLSQTLYPKNNGSIVAEWKYGDARVNRDYLKK